MGMADETGGEETDTACSSGSEKDRGKGGVAAAAVVSRAAVLCLGRWLAVTVACLAAGMLAQEALSFGARGVDVPTEQCLGCAVPFDLFRAQQICSGHHSVRDRRLADQGAQWLSRSRIGGGEFMYFGSQDLAMERIAARSMLIIIHGAARNAQDYFCMAANVTEKTWLINDGVLVITPRFGYRADSHRPTDCFWNASEGTQCSWNSTFYSTACDWKHGGLTDPASPCNISSFYLVDHLLRMAGNRRQFPLLRDVRVMGFSAGGETLLRYTLVSDMLPPQLSTVEDAESGRGVHPALKVHYIIFGPSVYPYLDQHRWIYECGTEQYPTSCSPYEYALYDPRQGRLGWDRFTGSKHLDNRTETTPFLCSSINFHHWGYGLNMPDIVNAVPFYSRHPSLRNAIMQNFPNLNVIFVVGSNDTCTTKVFPFCDERCWKRNHSCASTILDTRCPAMLQGPHRNQRARLYLQHLEQFYGRKVHRLYEIPNSGHQSDYEMFTAAQTHLEGVFIDAV